MLNAVVESSYWQFENQELADPELVDQLVISLCDITGIPYPDFNLYLLLTELISNAVDHGVLGLDSKLKDSAAGFQHYFTQRTKRLEALKSGWISVNAEWVNSELLRIIVQDSGKGFDYRHTASECPEFDCFHGRGLSIIKTLCESVAHIGCGNCIVVEYQVAPVATKSLLA